MAIRRFGSWLCDSIGEGVVPQSWDENGI
jgi:hypothetical protein